MNQKSNIFGSIGKRSAAHPWITILCWVVVAVAILGLSSATTPFDPDDDFTVNVESQTAANIEKSAFGEADGSSETIIVRSEVFVVDDPEFQHVVDTMIASLAPFDDDIEQIVRFYDAPHAPAMRQLVSADQHTLLIPVSLTGDWSDYDARWPELRAAIDASTATGFFIGAVGDISGGEINDIFAEDLSSDIKVGIPAALVVMVIVFGALVAAGLPLVLGIVTIVVGSGIVTLIGGHLYMTDIAMTLVSMIGLAVGIDYSLVLLERYRDERKRGMLKHDAIQIASATAGKAVFFSGMTTVLALFGVFFVPVAEFQGMGVAMSVAVAVAVMAALTLLPTMVSLIGDWINFPRFATIRFLRRQDETGERWFVDNAERGLWGRISFLVVARPVVSAVIVTAVLIAATIPALTIKLGQPSMYDLPESRFVTSYEILAEQYAAGQDDPLKIVLTGYAATEEHANQVLDLLATNEVYGTANVLVSEDETVILIETPLTVDASSSEAQSAVESLRSNGLQSIAGDNGHVGGSPGFVYDFNQQLQSSLPLVLGFVLTLSFIVMMFAFRSITVPLLSVVLNMLSVGAAYGAVVLVFQHGFMADILGLIQVETIVNWLPIMLFCVLFGLSMDYHVFVLSRIREGWDRSGDVDESIINGISHTGKIITGAAVIMIAVFGSFALGRSTQMQQMGFGMAIAVFLDVTLIRTILLPAGLKLLGKYAWWWPRAVNWVPELRIESELAQSGD